MINNNMVCWFEIYVSDIHRSQRFYEALFSVSMTPISEPSDPHIKMLGFPSQMSVYGSAGALVQEEGVAPGGNSTLVYFSCEDCSVQESKVVDAGGKVIKPKFSIGEFGFISLINDTEGNTVGLHSLI